MTGKYFIGIPFLLWALLGCLYDKPEVSGGDNFPNGVEPLGKSAAANLNDTAEWDSVHQFPAHPREAYEPPNPKSPSAYTADSGFTVSHAARGDTLLRIYTLDSPALYIRDTLFLPEGSDSTAPPDSVIKISGFAQDRNNGTDSTYTYSKEGGDGLLFPSRASFILITHINLNNPDGSASRKSIRLNAGPDGDPATVGDNKLLAFSFTETDASNNIRLQYTLLDGDSNQSVIDFSLDSNAVILESTFNGQTGDWDAAQWFLRRGLMLYPDPADSRLFSYYSQGADGATGESETQEVTTTGGQAVFQPGDSIQIKKTFVFAADDSLEVREKIYRTSYQPAGGGISGMISATAPVAGSFSDTIPKLESLRKPVFSLSANPPAESEVETFIRRGPVYKEKLSARYLGSGDSSHTEFTFCRIFSDLSWLTLKGSRTSGGLQGTLLSSEGDSLSVEFDSLGVLLEVP